MGVIIVWGFVVILPAMQPIMAGPYNSLNQCYAMLSHYIVAVETVDPNQYRGACQEFPKQGKSTHPDPDTQWLTSAQLAAKASAQ